MGVLGGWAFLMSEVPCITKTRRQTLGPKPWTLDPKPRTLNFLSESVSPLLNPNPQSQTLNPKPQALNLAYKEALPPRTLR